MDSDVDMFSSQPTRRGSQHDPDVPATQMRFIYRFVILFNWNESLPRPFKMFPRNSFTTDEIPDAWIDRKLMDKWRLRTLKPLAELPGQKMSIFAKVDGGNIFITVAIYFLN